MKVKNAVKTIASSFLVVIMCVCCLCFYGCNSVSETKSDLTTVKSTTETTTVNADCSFEIFKSIETKEEKIDYYKNCCNKYADSNDPKIKNELAQIKQWFCSYYDGEFKEIMSDKEAADKTVINKLKELKTTVEEDNKTLKISEIDSFIKRLDSEINRLTPTTTKATEAPTTKKLNEIKTTKKYKESTTKKVVTTTKKKNNNVAKTTKKSVSNSSWNGGRDPELEYLITSPEKYVDAYSKKHNNVYIEEHRNRAVIDEDDGQRYEYLTITYYCNGKTWGNEYEIKDGKYILINKFDE